MTSVFRLCREKHPPFDGQGSFLRGNRWTSKGLRAVYTSAHRSLAQLEYLVHVDLSEIPDDLIMAEARIPDDVSRQRVSANKLPSNWRTYPAPLSLRVIGDKWVKRSEHCILIVPSAVQPEEENWILNVAHPEFSRIDCSAKPSQFV